MLTHASFIQPRPPGRRTTYQRFQHKQTERDNSHEGFAGLLCDSIPEHTDMSAGGESLFQLKSREHGASVHPEVLR